MPFAQKHIEGGITRLKYMCNVCYKNLEMVELNQCGEN